jgi:phosphoribosyl-ATP pyrophosphohydrolase
MLIPSIDLLGGRAVQLRQGRELVLDLGDPIPIARRLAPCGEIAVIDLDAALGTGSNAALVERMLPLARCRVGGGIRDRAAALRWLDAGAARVILGTRADPELLASLPRERVIAAVDARDGEVVVDGWTAAAGERLEARIERLRPWVGGFLVTFVEIEGTLAGFDLTKARRIAALAGEVRVTFAGGISAAEEIGALDRIGADGQVGMALHNGSMHPADALWACLRSDRSDGLVPTCACDEEGRLLMLAYSDRESLRIALDERRGAYRSRSRGLWRKGATSGAVQDLLGVVPDCDRDALRFTVRQRGPACHTGEATCFGLPAGLAALERRIARAAAGDAAGSYTKRLLADPELLRSKLGEEAAELGEAQGGQRVAEEAADLLYFALVRAISAGVRLADVAAVLDRRGDRVSRRAGDEKRPSGAIP